MREGDWQEILQHPQRALTSGQWDMLSTVNLATLSTERMAALALRLIIEGRRLHGAAVQASDVMRGAAAAAGGKRTYDPDPKQGKEKKR